MEKNEVMESSNYTQSFPGISHLVEEDKAYLHLGEKSQKF